MPLLKRRETRGLVALVALPAVASGVILGLERRTPGHQRVPLSFQRSYSADASLRQCATQPSAQSIQI